MYQRSELGWNFSRTPKDVSDIHNIAPKLVTCNQIQNYVGDQNYSIWLNE